MPHQDIVCLLLEQLTLPQSLHETDLQAFGESSVASDLTRKSEDRPDLLAG
jgi:hypothetical protein